MNKHTLVRGSFLLAILFLFGMLEFERDSRPAAAEAGLSTAYAQYLPITFAESCVPRPLIPQNDPQKDLALETGINEVRMDHGLPGLKNSAKITQAALRHSNDMAFNNISGHTGSDGSDPGDRLSDACYHWQVYGEAIAGGYRTTADVIAAWMKSPEHIDVILSDEYTEFGAAYSYNKNSEYKHYYTVKFGLRAASTSNAASDYYSCNYRLTDDTGESWLNLYSIWPCDQLLESAFGKQAGK